MTCKECYHNEVCEALYELNGVPRIFACQCAYFRNTADVVEVRHGRWIKQKLNEEAMKEFHDMGLGKGMGVNSIYWTCSICENWGTPSHKYCCSCGAKMDGERKEE